MTRRHKLPARVPSSCRRCHFISPRLTSGVPIVDYRTPRVFHTLSTVAPHVVRSLPQALCEIFNRPAEIYAYCPERGARQLRTFHRARDAAGGSRHPIRLSYYGGGHYDSVVGEDFQAGLLTAAPGDTESAFLGRARRRQLGVRRRLR
jgi:hypothetical protein